MKKISIPVVGAETTLIFGGVSSTGRDPDTRPGISFSLSSSLQLRPTSVGGSFFGLEGVIGRSDARRLAAELIALANEADRGS